MEEVWKRLWDSQYEISNKGRVKTNRYFGHDGRVAILAQAKDQKGYYRVSLYGPDGRKTYKVHRLVAEYFVEKEEGKNEVNHKDGNKENNSAENLEWVTARENVIHAYKIGLKEKTRERARELGRGKGKDALKKYIEEKHKVKVCLVDKNGNRFVYPSQKDAAVAVGSCQPNICRAMKTGGFVCGYTVERW